MPIYWKEFEDGNSTDGNYIVMTLEEMIHQVQLWFDDFHEHDDRPPVFEPVRMSVAEFEAEPPFQGF
jgi:hypothetical protein